MLHARAVDPDDPLTPSGHLSYSFLGGGAVSKDGLFSIGEKWRLAMLSGWGKLRFPWCTVMLVERSYGGVNTE